MNQKKVLFLEFLLVLIAGCVYFFVVQLPEMQRKKGSSDYIIATKKYQGMIEFKTADIDFALVLNKKDKIYHLFFFNSSATCLYNQNIERSKNYKEGLELVIAILTRNNYLNNNSSINIITYDKVSTSIIRSTEELFSNYSVLKETKTLDDLVQTLSLKGDSTKSMVLYEIDFYSKDFLLEDNSNASEIGTLADTVYQKIEKFITSRNITSLEKNNELLPIQTISGDMNGKYYPNGDSWFYVEDGKVYAYIEFSIGDKIGGYCYPGSISMKRKGEC